MRPRTGVALNVPNEPEAFDKAVNYRRLSVDASCPDDVLSSAPVGSPDSASALADRLGFAVFDLMAGGQSVTTTPGHPF